MTMVYHRGRRPAGKRSEAVILAGRLGELMQSDALGVRVGVCADDDAAIRFRVIPHADTGQDLLVIEVLLPEVLLRAKLAAAGTV